LAAAAVLASFVRTIRMLRDSGVPNCDVWLE